MAATLARPLQEMAPADAISLARSRLLLHKPFYGHIFVGARAIPDPTLRAGLATTMDRYGTFEVRYNPAKWWMPDTPLKPGPRKDDAPQRMRLHDLSATEREAVSSKPLVPWSIAELAGALEHEAHHILNLHHSRGHGLDCNRFNLAADEAINQNLTHLPGNFVFPESYGHPPGLAAEAYYVLHEKQDQGQDQEGAGDAPAPHNGDLPPPEDEDDDGQGDGASQPDGGGEPEPEGQDTDPSDGGPSSSPTCDASAWTQVAGNEERYERRAAILAQQALRAAKGHESTPGSLPGALAEVIERMERRGRDWRHHLRRWGRRHAPTGMRGTILRPHRRHGWSQPGLRLRLKARFVVFVDTSGSVSSEQLAQFFAELEAMARWAEIVVVEVDAQVQRIYPYRRGTPSIAFQGRGGTVFAEAFEAMAGRCTRDIPNLGLLRGAAAVIVLTDGGLFDVPKENPMGVDVLWALTPGARLPAAWGEAIHIDVAEEA